MNELIEKFNDMDVTYILSENKDDMYLDAETIGQVFGVKSRTVNYHISELEFIGDRRNNISSILIRPDSLGRMRKKLYNLDVVIEVGYRVKSPQAREFRNWANNILKQYMLAPVRVPMVERLANAIDEKFNPIEKKRGDVIWLN